jgi:hypothetical protein
MGLQQKVAFSALIIIITIISILIFYRSQDEPKIKKPEPKWYLEFSVTDQKTTAYTSPPGGPISASGSEYLAGIVAVHPRGPVNSGGSPLEPLISFGTVIHLYEPVEINGKMYSSLVVKDTGDINYRLWPEHRYWFDLYLGETNHYTVKKAIEYGTPLKSYYWYEEWK